MFSSKSFNLFAPDERLTMCNSLAIRYQFETTQLVEGPTYLNSQSPPPPLTMSFNPKERRNPYLLTWSLRGIVEDVQVRQLFGDELTALREAFEVSLSFLFSSRQLIRELARLGDRRQRCSRRSN